MLRAGRNRRLLRGVQVTSSVTARFEFVERARPIFMHAGAKGRGRRAGVRRSGIARSNWSHCWRSGCAGPWRRIADKVAHSGHGRPSRVRKAVTFSGNSPAASARSRSVHSISVARVASYSRAISSARQLLRHRDRRELRAMQDLVGIGVADSAENVRVGQRALERMVRRAQRGAEGGRGPRRAVRFRLR